MVPIGELSNFIVAGSATLERKTCCGAIGQLVQRVLAHHQVFRLGEIILLLQLVSAGQRIFIEINGLVPPPLTQKAPPGKVNPDDDKPIAGVAAIAL